MIRRSFVVFFASAVLAWPILAQAQQAATPLVGFLNSLSPDSAGHLIAAFHDGLGEAGYVAGRNVRLEYRWAQGDYNRLPGLAAELVARDVAVIFAGGGDPSGRAARAATSTIPIIFISGDALKFGQVTDLRRPTANATGFSLFTSALEVKKLELLSELVPSANTIAMLVNPNSPYAEPDSKAVQAAGDSLGRRVHVVTVTSEQDFDTAFASLERLGVGALLVGADPFFNSRRVQLVGLAARYRMPAIYEWREFATVGGLMSYGTPITDAYRQAGAYVGKILNGAKPADLPVMQPTKFEFVINLKAARLLGLSVPPTFLARADEVIE